MRPSPAAAEKIVSAVLRHVSFDLAPVRLHLERRLEEPSEEYVCERAERIAAEEIKSNWAAELMTQCELGLEAARPELAGLEGDVGKVAEDLAANGCDSWLARAVAYGLAFEAAWDTLDERHGVLRFPVRRDSKVLS